VPFLLFFTGLSLASAPSAAFIHKTLFIWVALLAVPFLGERLGWLQVAALGVLLASQALIAPPTGVSWGLGETLIGAATLLWSVEVVLAKRLLGTRIDPLVVGVGRLGLGLIVLFGYLVIAGKLSLIGSLGASQWAWVLLTGALLAGYVGTWFSALKLAPATVVTSVLVLAAPVTALLQVTVNGTAPAPLPLAGYGLLTIGAVALVVASYRRTAADALPISAPA
jgi:drug/metabolite transporter (DMT)-like permease